MAAGQCAVPVSVKVRYKVEEVGERWDFHRIIPHESRYVFVRVVGDNEYLDPHKVWLKCSSLRFR